jgi:hypothetical protein
MPSAQQSGICADVKATWNREGKESLAQIEIIDLSAWHERHRMGNYRFLARNFEFFLSMLLKGSGVPTLSFFCFSVPWIKSIPHSCLFHFFPFILGSWSVRILAWSVILTFFTAVQSCTTGAEAGIASSWAVIHAFTSVLRHLLIRPMRKNGGAFPCAITPSRLRLLIFSSRATAKASNSDSIAAPCKLMQYLHGRYCQIFEENGNILKY